MRHRKKGNPLNRTSSHRKAMLSNLVTSLIDKGKIRTTHAIAKEGQRLAERMVTLGKQNSLHARRRAVSCLHDKSMVKKLFEDVAPQYRERHGGYTRVIKLGMRKGDGAMLSQLEFVGDGVERGKSAAPAKTAKAKAAAPEAETPEKKTARKASAKKAPAKKAKAKESKESSSKKK